jgi:hypothetical protein
MVYRNPGLVEKRGVTSLGMLHQKIQLRLNCNRPLVGLGLFYMEVVGLAFKAHRASPVRDIRCLVVSNEQLVRIHRSATRMDRHKVPAGHTPMLA